MSRRLKAVLHYDGSAYRGWQRQPDAVTLQGTCERALAGVLGRPTALTAAGRTDTGVHARGQVAHFDHDAAIAPADLKRAWNARLPEDIWVERLGWAPAGFHARRDAVARTYRYFVAEGSGSRSPFVGRYSWGIQRPLDWDRVEAATRMLAGTHDFRRYAKGVPAKREGRNPGQCTVYVAVWRPTRTGRALEITADRFLRHMVRALAGALVAVGRRRLTPADIAAALEPDGPRAAAAHAPPRGLFLWKVAYFGKPSNPEDRASEGRAPVDDARQA
ncbi:MAG TPA: tRNA pseudouridine(38-40) synthase TruA [Gemmatimonadota bacterium]|nr:tRNA pseudouridine(38-40) synthase TruA [Gemmatimonadota bacterium]